jgi:hypothetical protein
MEIELIAADLARIVKDETEQQNDFAAHKRI